jgi:hypothetical protein
MRGALAQSAGVEGSAVPSAPSVPARRMEAYPVPRSCPRRRTAAPPRQAGRLTGRCGRRRAARPARGQVPPSRSAATDRSAPAVPPPRRKPGAPRVERLTATSTTRIAAAATPRPRPARWAHPIQHVGGQTQQHHAEPPAGCPAAQVRARQSAIHLASRWARRCRA